MILDSCIFTDAEIGQWDKVFLFVPRIKFLSTMF